MKTNYSPKDWQLLSAYLDGQLPSKQKEKLERRLLTEPSLQEGLRSLQQTKMLLSQARTLKAPRSFTLTPSQVQALRPKRTYRFLPALSISSALATIMMIFAILMEVVINPTGLSKNLPAPATEMLAMESAPEAYSQDANEPTERPMIIEWGLPGQGGGGSILSAEGLGGGPAGKLGDTASGMGGAEVMPGPSALLPMGTPQPDTNNELETFPVDPDAGPILGLRSAEDAQLHNQAVIDDLNRQADEFQMNERTAAPYLRLIQTGLALIALITGGLALYLWRKTQS